MPSLEECSWDVGAAARFFGVSASTVRRMVHDGEVPHFRVRGQLRFEPARLRAWRAGQQRTGAAVLHPLRPHRKLGAPSEDHGTVAGG